MKSVLAEPLNNSGRADLDRGSGPSANGVQYVHEIDAAECLDQLQQLVMRVRAAAKKLTELQAKLDELEAKLELRLIDTQSFAARALDEVQAQLTQTTIEAELKPHLTICDDGTGAGANCGRDSLADGAQQARRGRETR